MFLAYFRHKISLEAYTLNMKKSIDESYYFELAEKNPEEVCRLALCDYDPIEKKYRISVWGEDYGIYPCEYKIIRL